MAKKLRTPSYVAAALFLAGGAHATPMQLTLTAVDLTNPATYSTTFSDSALGSDVVTPQSSLNHIVIPAGVQGDINFSGENTASVIGGALNSLITSALNVSNTSLTDTYRLTAALSGMNFVGPVNIVALTGSGTWQSSPGTIMHLAFYLDPANALGASTATDAPGLLVGAFTSPPADPVTSSYSYSPGSGALGVSETGLFSMTEIWSYTLAPGGSLVSRGQTQSAVFEAPEPGSLPLLGTGLAGLVMVLCRRGDRPRAGVA